MVPIIACFSVLHSWYISNEENTTSQKNHPYALKNQSGPVILRVAQNLRSTPGQKGEREILRVAQNDRVTSS